MSNPIGKRITELQLSSRSELRDRFKDAFKHPAPPRISRELLLRILAYHLQEQAEGGLSKAARRRLAELDASSGSPPPAPIRPRPGTLLMREWRGEVHHVTVLDEGFEYRGTRYDSLSQIARVITGTRWSGPRFFGLRRNGGAHQDSTPRD